MQTERNRKPSRRAGLARPLRVSPTTCSVRLALAASATVLALAGSGTANAACSFTDPTTVTCTAGAYNGGLPGGSFVPVVDLTLVLDPGVTVDPAAGVAGVTANWGGDVTVTTSADINTSYADGVFLYGSATATLNNSGTIYAYVDADNAVDISSNGLITVDNSGLIQAEGSPAYAAIAINAYSSYGDIFFQNSGTIAANSDTQYSEAIYAYAYYGNTTINNSGTISSTSLVASADAIDAEAKYDTTVINSGNISASSPSTYGTTAVFVLTGDDGHVDNSGTIYAYSSAFAGGIQVITVYGEASADNSGSIEAVSAGGFATGMGFYGGGSADADNSGTIIATGYDDTGGIYVDVDYGVLLSNSGQITATAGTGQAWGIYAHSTFASIDIDNSGTITAYSDSGTGYGIQALADGNGIGIDVTLSSTSSIDAVSSLSTAFGVFAGTTGDNSNVTVTAGGDVSAYSPGNHTYAIQGLSSGDSSDVIISVLAGSDLYAGSDLAGVYGVQAQTDGLDSDIDIDVAGSIAASSLASSANGVRAYTYAAADSDIVISVAASGSINATADYTAFGINAIARGAGAYVDVDNAGTVVASGYNAIGIAISASDSGHGYSDGDISATGIYRGIGLQVSTSGDGYAMNAGDISVDLDGTSTGSVPMGWGVLVRATYGDAYAGNSGTISVNVSVEGYYEANAVGIESSSNNGDAAAANSGLIQAYIDVGANDPGLSSSDAIGIDVFAAGDAYAGNSGTIDAESVYGKGFGIFVSSPGAVDVVNSGSISVIGGEGSDQAYGGAYGVFVQVTQGVVTVDNSGAITAVADGAGGYNAVADGIHLRLPGADVQVVNDGTITTESSGEYYAYARAIRVMADYIDISTGASSQLSATAGGHPDAVAVGIFAQAYYSASVSNGGGIDVLAIDGDAYGIAVVAYGDGALDIANSGHIQARANNGYVHGIRATAYGNGDTSISHDGTISATGDSLDAVGIQADAYGSGRIEIAIGAAGAIDVHGYYAAAGIALNPYGGGATSIDNQGDIYAYSYHGDAFGIVTLYGTGDINITNSGTITADAAVGEAFAIHAYTLGGTSVAIDNSGTLNGAIFTGRGDDLFYNTGTWNATGASYFGAGDDAIFNSGTINLQGSTIDLGIDPAGNQFVNDGLLAVSGDNVIDMGTGADGVTPNPYPFQNNGVIDFQDGAPDDSLKIIGDFAGDGDIDLDVSGLNGTSDLMYIDGNVDPGSVSTINIDLIDFPEGGQIEAPMVLVTGNSTSGNFVLGDVSYEPGFLDFDFNLVSGTNSSGQGSYALRFTPVLSDTGELAAVITPGVSVLLRDAVGTVEQRQATSQLIEGRSRVSMWARVFYNAGWVEPEGGAAFDVRTGGGETGFNFAATDRFGAGLILGRSELNQKLRDGIGSDAIKGNVYGGYGNMALPGGFSLDLSHRRLKFDAEIDANGVQLSSGGEADTSNMEAGYQWVSKKKLGLQLQFQQTVTVVKSIDTLAGPVPFDGDSGRYSITRLAGEVRKQWDPTPKGTIWVGRVLFNAIRESDGTSHYDVGDTLSGKTSLQGTSFRLEAGASAQRGHLLVYGSLVYEDGGVLHNFFGAHLGGRWVW
jgi:hypothetical protein